MDNFWNRNLRFAVDRRGSAAIRAFVVIGKWCWYSFLALLTIVIMVLVEGVILDWWLADDSVRQENLRARGFILKAPAIYKKHPTTIECTQRGQHKDCPYTDRGELKLEQYK